MEGPQHRARAEIEKVENGYLIHYMNRTLVFANYSSAIRKLKEIFDEDCGEQG
jgi:hypothetical protein